MVSAPVIIVQGYQPQVTVPFGLPWYWDNPMQVRATQCNQPQPDTTICMGHGLARLDKCFAPTADCCQAVAGLEAKEEVRE